MAENKEETIPSLTDPTWSDYVLGQLATDELIEGNPKTDGLRRLVEKFIGEIDSMETTIVQAPNSGNLDRAVVTARIVLRNKDGHVKTFTGSADACTRNSDPPYNMYPTSIAETRAYGRAFRHALRIRTAAAEELSNNATYAAESTDSGIKITGVQIKGLANLCSITDINLEKFVNMGEIKYKNLKEVPLNSATLMMQTLNEFQNGERKNVPEAIKGYDKNWRTSFLGD
jgi:hypothetical protein